MNKKILVTGGSGLVGKSLQNILPEAIYENSIHGDLTDDFATDGIVCFNKPEVVIHCAALVSGITENISRPYDHFVQNVKMNTNIIEAAIRYKVSKFIGILSTCAYPDIASSYPIKETQLHEGGPAPTNFSYGYAKRMMAVQIDAANRQFGLKYSYLIPCNLYGEHDKYGTNSHFVAALIKKINDALIHDADSITLMGDGSPLRQFMYAPDLARVIKFCIENDITESFNVSNDENYSIDEIARIALKACDAEHLKIKYINPHLNGQYRKDCDNSKLKNILPADFKFTSLAEGIKKTYEYYSSDIKPRK